MNPNNSGQVEGTIPGQNQNGLMASNPASGINNIPLGGENTEGVTKDEMRQLMNKIKASNNNFGELSNEVTVIADRVQDKDLKEQLSHDLQKEFISLKSSENAVNIESSNLTIQENPIEKTTVSNGSNCLASI